jgi:hypothetical protein
MVVFALLLPSLAAIFWSGSKAAGVARPGPVRSFVVDGQEHVAVLFNGALHLLDAQGRRRTRQPLAELGLAAEPTDMDWTTDAKGKVEAWFFDDAVPRLVRCEFDRSALFRAERCVTSMSGPQLKIHAASRAVHIAVEPARDRVFIADAKGHGVRAFDLQGRQLAQSAGGELLFPNRLRLAGDHLIVADNDHGRLVWLDIRSPRPSFLVRRTLPLADHPEATGGRKAADFALLRGPRGEPAALWLLAVKQGQKHGELLLYGPGLQPTVSADLNGHGDPLIVDGLGEDLLAADFHGVALYRIAADGRFLGAFGDGLFARELTETRARLRALELRKYLGWAGLAIALAVGFLLSWRYSEKPAGRRALEAFDVAPDTEASVPLGPLDLRPAAWRRRQILVAAIFLSAVTLGTLGFAAFLFRPEIPPHLWRSPIAWAVPVGLLAMLVSNWVGLRISARRRLWLARGRIEVRLEDRTVATTTPGGIMASPRTLLVGRVLLPYRAQALRGGPGRWIFDEDLVKRYVLAHLQPHQRLNDQDLLRAYLQRLPAWQISIAVVAAALALAYALRDMLP